jgi:hypothetical protein
VGVDVAVDVGVARVGIGVGDEYGVGVGVGSEAGACLGIKGTMMVNKTRSMNNNDARMAV